MSKNNTENKQRRQKPYNSNKANTKFKAPVRKMYRKTCETPMDVFDALTNLEDDVITEIINPQIETTTEEINSTHDYDADNILATMEKNIIDYVYYTGVPDITRKENIHTSLLVKTNKLAIQTNHFIGFGWRINTEKAEDRRLPLIIKSIDVFVTLSGAKTVSEKESNLLENGWVESEN